MNYQCFGPILRLLSLPSGVAPIIERVLCGRSSCTVPFCSISSLTGVEWSSVERKHRSKNFRGGSTDLIGATTDDRQFFTGIPGFYHNGEYTGRPCLISRGQTQQGRSYKEFVTLSNVSSVPAQLLYVVSGVQGDENIFGHMQSSCPSRIRSPNINRISFDGEYDMFYRYSGNLRQAERPVFCHLCAIWSDGEVQEDIEGGVVRARIDITERTEEMVVDGLQVCRKHTHENIHVDTMNEWPPK